MPLSKAKHFQYPLQLVSTTGEPRLHYCTLGPLHRAERQSPHSNPFYCTSVGLGSRKPTAKMWKIRLKRRWRTSDRLFRLFWD